MNRAGRKAFDACDVKNVEFSRRYAPLDDTGVAISGGLVVNEDARDSDTNYHINGYGAQLHCPRTEDDDMTIKSAYSSHDTQGQALRSVRRLAGNLLCGECRYSDMTPVEVSLARKDFAIAEAQRIEAYGFLQKARDEIADL